MCGIAGIIKFDNRKVSPHEISSNCNRQVHRGKDASGIWLQEMDDRCSYQGIALGHRRLSIIDLSSTSSQPMGYKERYWITYNGELYNYLGVRKTLASLGHEFHTNSDTEVILAAYAQWKEKCLSMFNGMFAFGIWDNIEKKMFCARDPLGIKPFYYKLDNEQLSFASESQALSSGNGISLNRNALVAYLFANYVPNNMSIYEGVQKLQPAHYMIIDTSGHIIMKSYWVPPTDKIRKRTRPEEASENLLYVLDKSVESQLVGDVKVGAFLSGGFDSSMIVASAAKHYEGMNTYSVGFDDGLQQNELPVADALAKRYHTRHTERIISSNEVIGFLDKSLSAMSEPVADSAIVPTYCLSEMAAADSVKVLLSGTGGDEVLGGYTRYIGYNHARSLWLKTPFLVRRMLGGLVRKNAPFKARLLNPGIDMMLLSGGAPMLANSYFSRQTDFYRYITEDIIGRFPEIDSNQPLFYKHINFDLRVYLPDLLLYTLDQLTMANTVEGRVPLLDIDLIKQSYQYAPDMHVSHDQTRLLMRLMAKGRVDDRTLSGKKQGFSGPVRHWITQNHSVFKERIMALSDIDMLKQIKLDAYFAEKKTSDSMLASEMFILFCFSTWYYSHLK